LQAGGTVTHMLNPATSRGAALLNSVLDTQAQIIAYVDDYRFMLISTIPAVACLLLMRKPPKFAAPPQAQAAE
jgi:DHA2 family multidrug resistance protein